ncbi:MAG: hypothetical protein K0V04_27815 [Deltaproteobacteria bacterium]|nr:hypothetical protein [Deltaproteobacteria bacterium]
MASPPLRAAFLLLPALLACENRVSQCNDLVALLNPHTEAMIHAVEDLAAVEAKPNAVDTWLTIMDQADSEVARLPLEDPRLAGFALRYRRQLADARAAAKTIKDAVAHGDAAGLHEGAKQADAFLDAQATVLEELNTYCAAGR